MSSLQNFINENSKFQFNGFDEFCRWYSSIVIKQNDAIDLCCKRKIDNIRVLFRSDFLSLSLLNTWIEWMNA